MRRKLRARKKAIVQSTESFNKTLERHIFRRTHNWQNARRFLITWIVLVSLLAGGLLFQMRILQAEYLTVSPIAGGVYNEGIVGDIKNINPIFAVTPADTAVSSLVFSSLLAYDQNNQLTGDLASDWKADANSKKFTVTVRDNAFWHDGKPVTADDIVFTYQTIQNPDTKSPLYTTWRGVKVEKQDDKTVVFTLPNAYSPFLHLLTTGIIPKHLLENVAKDQLRSSTFNTEQAIGTGPFVLNSIDTENVSEQGGETVQLGKNTQYYRGNVQLDGFTLRTYPDQKRVISALENKDIVGAVADVALPQESQYNVLRFTQTSAMMVFFNTTKPIMQDVKLRQALLSAINPSVASGVVGYPTVPVRSPILKDQVGYSDASLQQNPSPETTNKILNELGWLWAEGDSYRKKDGKELSIDFVSQNSGDYAKVAEEVQKQWAQYGIKTNVTLEKAEDISTTRLATKEYDALLYAITIGPDPDVYVYWHSSQTKPDAKPGYNFSMYNSAKADQALEDGRSRTDPSLRAVKYKPFLDAWRQDVPAVGLYQPRTTYVTSVPVYNLNEMTINTAAERYRNVHNWQINTEKVTEAP